MDSYAKSLITVVIPFYNAEKFLNKAIDSVLWQSYPFWELILLDDGSNDKSLQIAKKYAEQDKRISVISDGKNMNLGYRLNQIPSLVNTIYLARMDADDIMHPDRIITQLKILQENPEIDVLGSNAYSIDEFDNVNGIKIDVKLDFPELLDCDGFIHPSIMAKTEWFENNPYDIKAVRIEDAELWRRTKMNYNFKYYTKPLLYYREFGDKYYLKYFKSLKGAFHIFFKEVKNQKKISYIYQGVLRNLMLGIVFYIFNLVDKEGLLIRRRYVKIPHNKIEFLNKKYK